MIDGFSILRGSSGRFYVRCDTCQVALELEATHLATAIDEAEQQATEHDACNPLAPSFARSWTRGKPEPSTGRGPAASTPGRWAPP